MRLVESSEDKIMKQETCILDSKYLIMWSLILDNKKAALKRQLILLANIF